MAQETHYIKHSLTCLQTVKDLKFHLLIVQDDQRKRFGLIQVLEALEALVTQPSSFGSEARKYMRDGTDGTFVRRLVTVMEQIVDDTICKLIVGIPSHKHKLVYFVSTVEENLSMRYKHI